MPIDPAVDVGDSDTHLAFAVLAIVSLIELFAAPLTLAGMVGAACSIASVVWLARHAR